jgi:ABC-type multidrug transport system fused ATPase/permease subunit
MVNTHDDVGTSASLGKKSKPEADMSKGMWMGWPTLGDALFLEASKLLARLRKVGGGREHKGAADALVEELEELSGWQRAAHAANVLQHFIDVIAGRDGASRDDFIISRALRRAVRGELIMAMTIYMAQVVCSIAMPITAYIMLRWCENPEAPAWEGYAIMGGMAVANVLAVLLKELFVKRCSIMGEWTMSACQTLAYRKLLRLAVSDAFASNVGCISELVSGSSDALLGYWPALIGLLLQPIEILMLVGALYVFVGWAAFGGVAVVVVALACSVSMGRLLETHSAKRGDAAEKHSQLVSEAVTAIKAIKYNVWESRFEAKIRRSKEEEMAIVRRCGRILSVLNVSSNPSIDLISCGVVSLYVLAHGSTLTPAVLAVQNPKPQTLDPKP